MTTIRSSFNFINIRDPSDARTLSKSHAVRSHAARRQWQENACERAFRLEKKKKRGRCAPVIFLTVEPDGSFHRLRTWNEVLDERETDSGLISPLLGGGRVDPFRSYPVPWNPKLPFLVDHYIVSLAVDIPELDEPRNHGLLRKRWFPLTMTEPATFLVIILIAASHYASLQNTLSMASDLLQLKHEAIASINRALEDQDRALSDQIIGAVAKMASYEAMFGNPDAYGIHMSGLQRMVAMRGGLSSLGLSGLLSRILLWIDNNSAFLIGSPLYFPGERLPVLPNPGHFLGAF